ncbi:hypothetical protein [Luteimonas sp. SDU101]|uniref:hypothetical protein n=1 Tax=unclassified Luteimonas TaxID=2629088 RepID=UPI003EB8A0DF
MTSIIARSGALIVCALLALQPGARAQEAVAQDTATAQSAATAEPAPQSAEQEGIAPPDATEADPAVWGPYARLVGRTFAGETVAGWPGYASATRSIQWEVPGQVMVETGTSTNGSEIPRMRILPAGPGRLTFDVKMAPNSTGQITDAGTLTFDMPFGWESVIGLVDEDSYETKTLKRGEVQAHAIYRDVASAAHEQRSVEQAAEKLASREAARVALREAGIPDAALTDVPAERVLAYQEPVRGPSGTLRVSRAKAWEGSACYAAVYINGRWAARLDESEAVRFLVPAGDVRVSISADPQGRGACRLGQASETHHETHLAKGESLHVQFSLGGAPFREALLAQEP